MEHMCDLDPANNHHDSQNTIESKDTSDPPVTPELCPLCHLIRRDLAELNHRTRLLEKSATLSGIYPETIHRCQNNAMTVGNTRVQRNPAFGAAHSKHDAQQISQILCDELRRFCENTTIRGLPRIVRAHNRSLRLLWSTLVCILVLGCFICMFFLARQYLEYNVIHPPRVLRHTSSPFPAVTVCNLRPISPDGMRYMRAKGWKTPRQFVQDFAYYAQHLYFENKRYAEYSAASAAFSLAGFLESIPNDTERQKLGYQNDKLVTKCQGSALCVHYLASCEGDWVLGLFLFEKTNV
ncbi:unnamed protein product [Echinostoma caproni]|uniref:Amiloride-sensitive sodium channel n=1 Tax=Echinostoma caproni TaxID=27848 RepID=A0A183AQD0_9TREM|nr:unnamed protein product [Echinostoma caproni]